MEDANIDELFKSLAEASSSAGLQGVQHEIPELEQNVLCLENDKVAAQQRTFRQIEQRLHKIPKIDSGFDKIHKQQLDRSKVEPLDHSLLSLNKLQAKQSRSDKWFEMSKPVITPQMKRDLAIIKNRAALDPKRHYRKEKWKIPERFSVGTIIEGTGEFYSSRLKNSQRKGTILDTLMADGETLNYFRRKYSEIQTKTTAIKKHSARVKGKRRRF